ncbi:MAG: M23 family metallopeptidase [Akkermansiaceae bacterium]
MAKKSTQQTLIYCFVAAAVIALIIATTLAYLSSHADRYAPLKSMDTWQQADAPLGYPFNNGDYPDFDSRFIELSAFERALIPRSTRMAYPMGSLNGALTYNAQPFWSDNKKRGGHHTGDDINGIGGMNTDLGDPVYAVSNGLVVYRGEPSKGWGNSLILAHRAKDGTIHQIMYSHLHSSSVSPGDLVSLGEKIGTVGTANMTYPAHLHLELRQSSGVWIAAGYVKRETEHLDPVSAIEINSLKNPASLYISPMLITKLERMAQARQDILIQSNSK